MIVTVRFSSISPQSLMSGVPVTLPSGVTVNPFLGVGVIVLLSLLGVTTLSLVYALFSITSTGVPTSTVNGFPAVSVDD